MPTLQCVLTNLTGAHSKTDIILPDLVNVLFCNPSASRGIIIDAYHSPMSVETFIDIVLTCIYDAVL